MPLIGFVALGKSLNLDVPISKMDSKENAVVPSSS